MTLEQQVCSLELAKRLKELGVKQESLFAYIKTKHVKGIYYVTDALRPLLRIPDTEWYAAFTAAELAALLPYKIMLGEEECYLMIEKDQNNNDSDHWRVLYETLVGEQRCSEADDSLADALAAMLIHLLENKLITV